MLGDVLVLSVVTSSRLRAKGSVGQMAEQGWQHVPLRRGLEEGGRVWHVLHNKLDYQPGAGETAMLFDCS